MDLSADHEPASLQSICHVRASELYPKAAMQVDTGFGAEVPLPAAPPFRPLCGEAVEFMGRTSDGGVLALSNYRLFVQSVNGTTHHVPLGLVENLEVKDIFYLHVPCKDGRSHRLVFTSNDVCQDWFRRILKAISPPKSIDELFAFSYFAWSSEEGGEEVSRRLRQDRGERVSFFKSEVERLQFDLCNAWRISKINEKGDLCPTYPREILVPSCISDEVLESVGRFRSYKRIPAVVWRHKGNGAVLARCSQPDTGWLGYWRSREDEYLLKAIAYACAFDRGHAANAEGGDVNGHSALDVVNPTRPEEINGNVPTLVASTPQGEPLSCGDGDQQSMECNASTASNVSNPDSLADEVKIPMYTGNKLLIMDARSYATAVANRARGGGCECPEYYPSCEIQFMNLANIHSIRKSFHSLRALCATGTDQVNWLSLLEGTRWLQHMSGLMRAAVTAAQALDREARPVVVHCSDGWDRTTQIVALAEVLLDPYYRTIQGFQVLCEREWLEFGHKFADRCGHSIGGDDHNERCPVFLQWLDCIHQVMTQYVCVFEFSEAYLVKLVQHTYSNLFGTFLCNSSAERAQLSVADRTFSVWKFLQADCFKNHLYNPEDKVLWPSCNVGDLELWRQLYLGSEKSATTSLPPAPTTAASNGQGTSNSRSDSAAGSGPGSSVDPEENAPSGGLSKSYDDIITACEDRDLHAMPSDQPRRCSDSSLNIDLKFVNGTNALPGDEGRDDDRDKRETSEEREKQLRVESELSSAALGLSLFVAKGPTPEPEPLAAAEIAESRDEPVDAPPVPSAPLDNSDDDDDDDTEVTLSTEVNGECRGVPHGAAVDGGGTQPKTEEAPEARVESVPEKVAVTRCVDLLSTLAARSVDSSTDTLVAQENLQMVSQLPVCESGEVKASVGSGTHSSSPAPRAPSPPLPLSSTAASAPLTALDNPESLLPDCRVCATSKQLLADSHRDHFNTSFNCTVPPIHNVMNPLTLSEEIVNNGACDTRTEPKSSEDFDEIDGLPPVQIPVQSRVQQITTDHNARYQELRGELLTVRGALDQQVKHFSCSQPAPERADDVRSLPESGCSGEPASADESLPSDISSWEAVEELPGVRWVPDHAVSNCMRCAAKFSSLRRRHHCRSCGKVFCAHCSANAVPLPKENLYDPVRVCASCFSSIDSESMTPPPAAVNGHCGTNGLNGQPLGLDSDLDNHQDCPAEMAESALTCFGLPPRAEAHQRSSPNSCSFSYAAVVAASSQGSSLEGKQGGQQRRKTAAAYV